MKTAELLTILSAFSAAMRRDNLIITAHMLDQAAVKIRALDELCKEVRAELDICARERDTAIRDLAEMTAERDTWRNLARLHQETALKNSPGRCIAKRSGIHLWVMGGQFSKHKWVCVNCGVEVDTPPVAEVQDPAKPDPPP